MECFNCEKILTPVFSLIIPHEDCHASHKMQDMVYRDSLAIVLEPGYGGYYDGNHIRQIMCSRCADELGKLFPRLHKMMFE